MPSERNARLFTLLSLYVAQAVPLSFFSTVVPVIMRQQHYSLEMIGLMQLIKLPWIIKFLWAPMVDRTGSSLKGYRRWILYSELFYAFSVAAVAFFNPQHQFGIIILLMVLAITASATQDIATDAWAILTLPNDERSLGNSMQSAGSFVGALLGSGMLLVVYHYLGWEWLLVALSGFVVLAVVPVLIYRPRQLIRKRPRSKSVSLRDIGTFFARRTIWPHLLMLALFHAPLMGIMTMIKPMMVDLGYAVNIIGIIPGIFGTAIGALTALLAGLYMRGVSHRRAALLFAAFNLLPALFFIMMHPLAAAPWVMWAGVALLWGAYGAGMVFVFTIAMEQVRHCREGTDFTLQIVVVHLSSLVLAVLSGRIAGAFSYQTLFVVSLLLGLLTLGVVHWKFRRDEKQAALAVA